MKVLITGGNGQLGHSLRKLSSRFPETTFLFTDVDDLDITRLQALKSFFIENKVDFVVNCAAYTAVDKAEEQKDLARLLNATAVEYLAKLSRDFQFKLIQISTDYVFGGTKYRPYTEDDLPQPESVYAITKYEGEQMVLNHSKDGIVMRTSWLYSEFGNNFAKTMIKLGTDRDKLTIVADQIGTPTYGGDLADAVLKLIHSGYRNNSPEIFHFSNEGVASWYDFAHQVIQFAGIDCEVLPIKTEDYPLPAKRPFYSLMSKEKYSRQFKTNIPHWRESLKKCIEILLKN